MQTAILQDSFKNNYYKFDYQFHRSTTWLELEHPGTVTVTVTLAASGTRRRPGPAPCHRPVWPHTGTRSPFQVGLRARSVKGSGQRRGGRARLGAKNSARGKVGVRAHPSPTPQQVMAIVSATRPPRRPPGRRPAAPLRRRPVATAPRM
jgi:hypothetical protein